MTLRVLIVDDEPLARARLRALLEREPDVQVAGESGDGVQAITAVEALRPDLVFLDVQMPALDGFGVLEALGEPLPAVVFVTAYDRYALRAFEVHALDYLLKPFDRERFRRALERARATLQRDESLAVNRKLLELLDDVRPTRKAAPRLVVKTAGRVFFLRPEEIDWVEAAGNYVKVHVGREDHLLRETMSALEGRLDADRFVRIHRSTLVNLDRVKELQPWFHGDYKVILRDGTELTLSRGYRPKLQELLGNPL
jgi:two-component system, LytTR family, response regulator